MIPDFISARWQYRLVSFLDLSVEIKLFLILNHQRCLNLTNNSNSTFFKIRSRCYTANYELKREIGYSMLVTTLCWWLYGGDSFMMVWWQTHYISDFFVTLVTFSLLKIGHQHPKSVTMISNLSPILVANINVAGGFILRMMTQLRFGLWHSSG